MHTIDHIFYPSAMTCGPGKTYQYSMSPCPDDCGNPDASLTCDLGEKLEKINIFL